MSRFATRIAIAGLGAILVVNGAAAQARPVPTIVLDKGAVEFGESFSQLGGLVELRDGRVIVVDTKERELRLVDFARESMSKISRLGGGPLEYQVPGGGLLTGAADTAVYFDGMQQRFLRLSPAGVPLGTIPFLGVGTKSSPTDLMSGMIPTQVDAAGRLYGQTLGMTLGGSDEKASPMPTFADTVELQVRNLRGGVARTLARVRSPIAPSKPKIEMSGTSYRMTITAPNFASTDAWAALPDGRVAILRNGVYQVHFASAGRPETTGPTIAYSPLPVTASDRKAVMDSLKKVMAQQLAQIEKTAGAAVAGKFNMEVAEPASWAATRPPYEGLWSSPDGRLWVLVPTPKASRTTRIDLLDGSGALIAHVQLAPNETPLGFGRGTIYTVRTDSDDLQYLRRYAVK